MGIILEPMTKEEIEATMAMAGLLKSGKWYRFNEPVYATAFSWEGPKVCSSVVCAFIRAKYLGFREKEKRCVFEGWPINDERPINISENCWNDPEIINYEKGARLSWFYLSFAPGSSPMKIDSDQNEY